MDFNKNKKNQPPKFSKILKLKIKISYIEID